MLYSFILEFINTKNPITKMRCLHSVSSVYIPRVVLNTNIIICILYVVVSRYAIPYVSIHQINEMLGNYKTQKKALPPFYGFFFYVFICLLLFLDFYAYLELWYHVCCFGKCREIFLKNRVWNGTAFYNSYNLLLN